MSGATLTNHTQQVGGKTVKELARRLADLLPDDATWDDLLYHIQVCQRIEAGLEDTRRGRVVPAAEVWERLGLGERA